ncbi:hypothetical protein L9F63_011084, partial [Diploptera punctata]
LFYENSKLPTVTMTNLVRCCCSHYLLVSMTMYKYFCFESGDNIECLYKYIRVIILYHYE